ILWLGNARTFRAGTIGTSLSSGRHSRRNSPPAGEQKTPGSDLARHGADNPSSAHKHKADTNRSHIIGLSLLRPATNFAGPPQSLHSSAWWRTPPWHPVQHLRSYRHHHRLDGILYHTKLRRSKTEGVRRDAVIPSSCITHHASAPGHAPVVAW